MKAMRPDSPESGGLTTKAAGPSGRFIESFSGSAQGTPSLVGDDPSSLQLLVERRSPSGYRQKYDNVAAEMPVALEYNSLSHAVMLATPDDMEEFALGFSLSEGIIDGAHELYECEPERSELGLTLHLRISAAAFARLKERRRALVGRTGCGLCGIESLKHVRQILPEVMAPAFVPPESICIAMAALPGRQSLQSLTGAAHAAAWASLQGDLLHVREDIGRHNALDKLIGAMARDCVDMGTGFVVVTSRASFEMVQKTAIAGAGLMAAVSAPTTLAVDAACRTGMTLVGFARGEGHVVYAHPQRLVAGHLS